MSQPVQPVGENTQKKENEAIAEKIISETLQALDITPEMAQKAKLIGLNVDKMALLIGIMEKRMTNLEDTVIQLNQGIKPVVELSRQIEEAKKVQSQPQSQPQASVVGGGSGRIISDYARNGSIWGK